MWRPWLAVLLSAIFITSTALAEEKRFDRGIYLTQYTLENTKTLQYLMEKAKATGINTFVIDHEFPSTKYYTNTGLVKANGFKHVARIIVFPDGGTAEQIKSKAHWEKRYELVQDAIKAGADEIQLDYIRYSSKVPPNAKNADDIYDIIKWYKDKLAPQNIPLQIDIFGETSFIVSPRIGQDIKKFSSIVDGANPMVYPSHYWPYQKYSAQPYKTIYDSLNSMFNKFDNNPPFKLRAFIEAANYKYIKSTSDAQKQKYLLEEIRAVEAVGGMYGWYVWSAHNNYDNLFKVLENNKTQTKFVDRKIPPVQAEKKDTKTADAKS